MEGFPPLADLKGHVESGTIVVPPHSRQPSLRGVRILFVLPSLGLGGAERQAFLLARHLLEHEQAAVTLVGLNHESTLTESCRAAGLPYAFFELRHAYRSRVAQLNDLRRFVGLLRRERVQIVLPYCMFQNVLCGLTWRAGGAEVCIWNQRDEGRSRLDPWIERLAVRQTRCFISNSRHGARFVADCLRVPDHRVHIVANGVDTPGLGAARTDWREKLGLDRESFIACMVANLHGKKDHATLIAAWRHVVDEFRGPASGPHLLLAGAFDDQHQALVRQVNALSLQRHVHFLGEVLDTSDLLRNVDLAVFSSLAEGVPNAILEAMAHGLAVVATDYAGIREAVGSAAVLPLAKPHDARDFADRVLAAAADPDLRQRIGDQARHRVIERFGIDRMASEMTRIIADEWQRATGATTWATRLANVAR